LSDSYIVFSFVLFLLGTVLEAGREHMVKPHGIWAMTCHILTACLWSLGLCLCRSPLSNNFLALHRMTDLSAA
jgi:hypothetical protein